LADTGESSWPTPRSTSRAGNHIFIGRGVFHATTNIGEDELELIEVEHPRNNSTWFGCRIRTVGPANPTSRRVPPARTCRRSSSTAAIPGAKYRPTDIHGHFRFTICKAAVDQDDDHQLLLAVPVGAHSLTGGIEVFAHGSLAGMSLHETEHCFTISVSI